jgi:glucose-6-phosphate dehydrogenase assembly protein OpcA
VHDLYGTASPLLVADLPVFLWWLSDPSLDDHLFRVLDDTADRLIVDSARFRRPVETLARLAERISRSPRPGEAALSDLNWARLTPWRELIAQFFDAPHLQSYLPALTEVSIEYCPGARDRPNPCQALLLAGWLVSRLGWHYTDSQPLQPQRGRPGYRLSLEGPQPVGILLRPGPPDPASTGDVTSVRLVAGAGLPPARFTVNRADDGVCAVTTVHVEGMKPVSRVAGMEPPTEAQLLSQNLDVLGRDPIYEAALATAARFEIPT